MAQEVIIKKKVRMKMAEEGFVFWSGAKARFQSSDIFGIFDCICVERGTSKLRFIQYTSKSNVGARRRKIKNFFLENNVFIESELWGYENGQFAVEHIENPLL